MKSLRNAVTELVSSNFATSPPDLSVQLGVAADFYGGFPIFRSQKVADCSSHTFFAELKKRSPRPQSRHISLVSIINNQNRHGFDLARLDISLDMESGLHVSRYVLQ